MYTSINEGNGSRVQEPAPVQPPREVDPYQEYDSLYKKYDQAAREKDEAARELQRLKDAQKLRSDAMEATGLNAKGAAKVAAKAPSGYQLWQLLLVVVVFMLLGAILGKY